ncbi:MAG: HDOD domain-containing protein, partial [Candidatus Sumerlaeota bacterium]
VGTAICAQRVAEQADSSLSGSAFTCGLLHCIGKIILNAFVVDDFNQLLEMVEKTATPFIEAENKILGITHAEVGAQIAEHWELPEEIVAAIRYYQNPLDAEEHAKLVSVVHVGNILCVSFGIGVGSDGLAYVFHPGALELLKIKVEDLFALSVSIHDQFKNAEALINIE